MVRVVVGQPERGVRRLVLVLQRERVVAVGVRTGREQEDQLADAEGGGVDLGQHVGEPQRVRRPRVPGVGGRAWVETGQPGQRVEVRGQQLDEVPGPPLAAMLPLRVLLHPGDQLLHRPRPLGRGRAGPQRQQVRAVRVDRAGRGRGGGIDQVESEVVAQHLERRQLADEIRIRRAARLQVQHVADVPQLRETVAAVAALAQLAPQPDEDAKLGQVLLLGVLGELQPQLLRAAGHAGRKRSVLLVGAVAEIRETRLPQLVELAVAEAGLGQEGEQPDGPA